MRHHISPLPLSSQAGVTLIQMAILLTVISLLMVPFFQFQNILRKSETKERQFGEAKEIAEALRVYVLENGHYPMPADPGLNIFADVNAGQPIDRIGDFNINTALDPLNAVNGMATNNFWNTCVREGWRMVRVGMASPAGEDPTGLNAGLRPGVVCHRGSLWRRPYGEFNIPSSFYGGVHPFFDPINRELVNNLVFTGAVPYTVLGLNPEQSLDQYGSKFRYTVTFGLTRPDDFQDDRGNINIIDNFAIRNNQADPLMEGGTATRSFRSVGGTSSNAHFTVISHGPNRRGAVAGNGQVVVSCPASTFLEYQNCAQEAVARVLTENGNTTTGGGRVLNAYQTPDPNSVFYFDDAVVWATSIYGGFWTPRVVTNTAGVIVSQASYLSTGASGRVNIGAVPPALNNTNVQDGLFRVFGGNVRGNGLWVSRLCDNPDDSSASRCFDFSSWYNENPDQKFSQLPTSAIDSVSCNLDSWWMSCPLMRRQSGNPAGASDIRLDSTLPASTPAQRFGRPATGGPYTVNTGSETICQWGAQGFKRDAGSQFELVCAEDPPCAVLGTC